MADAIFRVSTRGAGRTGRRLTQAGAEIQEELRKEILELGDAATAILEFHAPFASGELSRGLVAVPHLGHARLNIEVRSTATDPESGFNYTAVTRWGHRRARIYPKRARFLRVEFGPGDVGYFRSVRAHHPASDWVTEALPELDAEAFRTISRIDRAIDQRVFRP